MNIFAFEFANSIFKMIDKTQGFVLGTVPYNDHSQFVHIYTQKFGKMSFKVSVFAKRSKKAQQQKLMFHPMTKLELDILHSETSDLHQIKDATLLSSPLSLGMDNQYKFSQCLYIAELLDKTIKEIEQNQMLWDFISNSLEVLYLTDGDSSNFHLLFTAKLCMPLGFGIDLSEYQYGMQFDLQEGCFTAEGIYHPYYLNSVSAEYLFKLLSSDYADMANLKLNGNERSIMLDILMAYLRLHIPEIGELKSIDVLKTIYS